MKVSISEAARLAGTSRQNLYRRYLNTGRLSVEKDGDGPPVIDTSELVRVFGELKGEQTAPVGVDALQAELEALRRQVAERDVQLRDAREREEWLRQHVSDVTGALRLLEDKSAASDTAARLEKAREVIRQQNDTITRAKDRLAQRRDALAQAQEELAAERNKGFWTRLFNRGQDK